MMIKGDWFMNLLIQRRVKPVAFHENVERSIFQEVMSIFLNDNFHLQLKSVNIKDIKSWPSCFIFLKHSRYFNLFNVISETSLSPLSR